MEVETPSLIRYGELTKDQLFVTAAGTPPRPASLSPIRAT